MFIDFENLKATISVQEAAETLGLTLKAEGSQFRTACPACKTGGDRAIVLTPAKGLFYCFSAKKGGDCIGLASHVMQVGNNDAAHFLAEQLTPPQEQKSEGRKQPAHAPKETVFDAVAFASKLAYVDDLGITEEEAKTYGVGEHRGKLYIALRDNFGHTAGFVCVEQAKFPKTLLKNDAVVKLKRA